ncbi:MAG TPA: hypothetical protein VI815_01770 [Candidatus Nanoarchaeia archaeon]|nr:hypothetical protein [Candidatus Nanoarchaeia archaeon]
MDEYVGKGFCARVYYLESLEYVQLRGRLSILENIEYLERIFTKYANNGRKKIVIDLSRVVPSDNTKHKSLDTSVLSVLLKFRREVDIRSGQLEVYLTNDQAKIFDLAACEKIFDGCLKRVK